MKTPSKKTVIIIVVAIIVIFALRAAKSKWENSGGDSNETPEIPNPSGSNSSASKPPKNNNPTNLSTNCSKTTVLKKGMTNFCVKSAQELINRNTSKIGISRIGVDGIFGGGTEGAMIALLGKKTGTYKEMVTKINSL